MLEKLLSFIAKFIGLTLFIGAISSNASASFNGPFEVLQSLFLMSILFTLSLIVRD